MSTQAYHALMINIVEIFANFWFGVLSLLIVNITIHGHAPSARSTIFSIMASTGIAQAAKWTRTVINQTAKCI